MKKILCMIFITMPICAMAEEYIDDYGAYDTYYDEYEYVTDTPATTKQRRDNYVGIRIHKNERISFKYDIHDAGNSTVRDDNFGFGAVVGNRLSDHVKIEFETLYTGANQTKRDIKYDFDVWANMLNVYLFQEYADAIAPYAGLGIGFANIWGNISSPDMSDSVFDLAYSAMIGVNFALNDRIDLNLGLKYHYYGELEHKVNGNEYAITDVDATEFYFGAVYKFGL